MSDNQDVIADRFEPVIGWKAFNVDENGLLIEPVQHNAWLPFTKREAFCRTNDRHRGPLDGCTCGLYAGRSPVDVLEYLSDKQAVLAQVALWGKVIEHNRGYRGQFGYVRAFHEVRELTPVRKGALEARYGMQVSELPDSEKMKKMKTDLLDKSFVTLIGAIGPLFGFLGLLTWALSDKPTATPLQMAVGVFILCISVTCVGAALVAWEARKVTQTRSTYLLLFLSIVLGGALFFAVQNSHLLAWLNRLG